MKGKEELDRVLFLISLWLRAIKSHNAIGFLDINKVAEGVSLKLLNEIYDYQLENLNYEKNNYPGIDLGDKTNKIGFQITSRIDIRKILESLKKFVDGPNETYSNGIRFLILSYKKKSQIKKNKYLDICPYFEPEKHILNADDLVKAIQQLYESDRNKFYRIKEIFEVEIAGKAMKSEDSRLLQPKPLEGNRKYHDPQSGSMTYRFDFALSFAGPDREIAKKLSDSLKKEGFAVFFDEDFEHELLGEDASQYLSNIYTHESRYCIVLISRKYDQRGWTQLERELIQSRELMGERNVLLPVKIENYSPEWLPATRIYFDMSVRPVEELVEILKRKFYIGSKDKLKTHIPLDSSKQYNFLRSIWDILDVDKNPKCWIEKLFPSEIIQSTDADCTLKSLLNHSKASGALSSVYQKTLSLLKKDWQRFTPIVKRRLIDEINRNQITEEFHGLLFLTLEEEDDLKIAWGYADIKYFEKKEKAYQECKLNGVDLINHSVRLRFNLLVTITKISKILQELLRSKVKIDVEQVMSGAGRYTKMYAEKIFNRTESEYLVILNDFRNALENHMDNYIFIDEHLKPFQKTCEAIAMSALLPGLVGYPV